MATDDPVDTVDTDDALDRQILDWHAWLDDHPEPAWQEHATTDYLVARLEELGIPTRRLEGRTGGFAELGEGPRWIGLRADLDAIWMGEDDGYAVHSCGHSAHMAMALGAMQLLAQDADALPDGTGVRLLLQPAEETGVGALELIQQGALDGMTHLFGMHLRPVEELEVGRFAPALHSGASVTGVVTITGEAAHGSRPHLARNPVDALVALHQVLPTLRYAPGESYSAKITRLRAGGRSLNVIPGTAEAALDVRAQRNAVIEELQERISAAGVGIGQTYGVEVTVDWRDLTPAAEVHPEAAQIFATAIGEVAGADRLVDEIVTPGGDDFHYYSYGRPELRSALLAVGAGVDPGLHHPEATYDTSVLGTGARILARAVRLAADAQA